MNKKKKRSVKIARGEDIFDVALFNYQDALQKLTFKVGSGYSGEGDRVGRSNVPSRSRVPRVRLDDEHVTLLWEEDQYIRESLYVQVLYLNLPGRRCSGCIAKFIQLF